ncbi:MAG: cupin domain-containing protein [Thermus sp.]|uniref:cupin domain-containing protein n=1 Tax=Thermus sp. TaxID=275 RepID=UPI003D11C598
MEIRDLKSLVRYDPEKMAKIPVFHSERMLYDLYALLPGQVQKVHAHEGSDKVYYVLEGEVVARVGEEEALLAPGMAVLAPAGVSHGVRNASGSPALLLVVMAPRP